MKTKEKDERKESYKLIIIVALGTDLILSILSIFFITQFNQANLTIAQAHSQILNLTHSLAQANATTQALRSNLSQAQATINMQKAQITCLLYTSPSPRDRTRSRMPSSA